MNASNTHLIILPTFNTGPQLRDVVADVLRHWQPVLVVVDGSTDGSERQVLDLAASEPALDVMRLPRNTGKGAAVLAGARAARERGFSHALVMDADGQHPTNSIAGFMDASDRHPDALILGRPIFPENTPTVRRHGRKLSIGLVHLELLGPGIADPLFGFRVYPLAPLLAVLEPCRGGRRYDFDTEAAVRLGWAGVPPHNLAAPVRYFSRAEGGVSHFHYLRDNAVLVWMHTRLIAELLLWRWPEVLRHRRQWQTTGLTLAVFLFCATLGRPAETDPLVHPDFRLPPAAPAWSDLGVAFAQQPDVTAGFIERRQFSFRREPVELSGEVRVSARRGLSLRYLAPEERTVILDDHGMVTRGPAGEKSSPADPRAAAANAALRHILAFDLAALEQDFDLFGQRDGTAWILALVPRTDALRRTIGRITVAGEATTIRRILLRRSAKNSIEILIAPPRPSVAFTAEEVAHYFR